MQLRLLGGFGLTDEAGVAVPLPGRKDRALLAYLALAGDGGAERGRLAGLLWHDRAEPQARKSLRQSLVTLRKVLNRTADILPVARDGRVRLSATALDCDVVRFEALATADDDESLKAAAELVRGPLLPELAVREPDYQAWLAGERGRLDDMAAGVLLRLARRALER